MTIFEVMAGRIHRLAACEELNVAASELPGSAATLSGDSAVLLMAEVAGLVNDAGLVQSVLAGVMAQQSRREDGHSGLAAVHGHATPAALIQAITGASKADATRQVRVGTSLLEPAPALEDATPDGDPESTDPATAVAPTLPWHEPLRRALLEGTVTSAQFDAIRTGLGEPAVHGGEHSPGQVEEAWSLAAVGLIGEATTMTVEELTKRARTMRDILDPVGAEERFARRYQNRSYRMWIDRDGQHCARIAFDDEMGLWVRSLRDAALRPPRGGPRFITDHERAAADQLADDPRSNEQPDYDLLVDVLRAGAVATAADVFGTRQPGLRMVVVKDTLGPRDPIGRLLTVGHAEDGGDALPGSIIDRAWCMQGTIQVTVDQCGNPLDLGREQRLYTSRQRVALAARDGGCLWPGCQRTASYCEAHHCDHFVEHEGRTDIDRGVLLCRFHHMLLHNKGWHIVRDGPGPFVLHPPPGHGDPILLTSNAPWKWAWDPPPPPQHATWRAA